MEKNNSHVIDIHDILSSIECGDADEVIIFMNKVNYVNKHHTNAISHHLPTEGEPREYYYTRLSNNKKLKGATQKALINKLYEYYQKNDIDYSFAGMFELALTYKQKTENPKNKTILDYRNSYKRFITPELSSMDIREIKASYIKEYIQTQTLELKPTKKALYKFKGVLNLVFEYALDPERQYITINPVPHKNRAYSKNCVENSRRPEDKAFQPEEIELIKKVLWERINTSKYSVNSYAILFSIETGVREGEIPSLKWSDIYSDMIHIHSQQNDEIRDGKKVYYYNPSTKNEKGVSRNGRYIPLTQNVKHILECLKSNQQQLNIKSEWVFCKRNGDWITTIAYSQSLYQLCKGNPTRGTKGLNLNLSNNHAFRMALNSYVFIPMGLSVAERAKLLGHSVETNLKYYTFARTDDYLKEISAKWNSFNNQSEPGDPRGPKNVIAFSNDRTPTTPEFTRVRG